MTQYLLRFARTVVYVRRPRAQYPAERPQSMVYIDLRYDLP